MKTLMLLLVSLVSLAALPGAVRPKLCCFVGGEVVEGAGDSARRRASDFIFDISCETMVLTCILGGFPKREVSRLKFLGFSDDAYVQTSRYAIVGTPDTLTVGRNELCNVGIVTIVSPRGVRTYRGEFSYYHK